MRYLDTSLLVTSLTNELRQGEIAAWLIDQPAGELFISWWTLTEFDAATRFKVRTGSMPEIARTAAKRSFASLAAATFTTVPVSARDFTLAGSFAGRADVNLRASDALHLAVASAHGCEVVTLDKRMASGGAAVGVATLLL